MCFSTNASCSRPGTLGKAPTIDASELGEAHKPGQDNRPLPCGPANSPRKWWPECGLAPSRPPADAFVGVTTPAGSVRNLLGCSAFCAALWPPNGCPILLFQRHILKYWLRAPACFSTKKRLCAASYQQTTIGISCIDNLIPLIIVVVRFASLPPPSSPPPPFLSLLGQSRK